MIKLIASDVDGTLVPDGSGTLNPEYYTVIRALHEKGILFVAASGRQYAGLKRLFYEVKDDIAFISESGAVVWKQDVPQVIAPIPYAYIREIAKDLALMPGADLMVGTPTYSYCLHRDSQLYQWLRKGYQFDIKALDGKPFPVDDVYVKASIYYPEHVEEITRDYVQKWQDKLHLCLAGDMWLDGVMPQVNKGAALEVIQKDLGISREETWVFGDNMNDLELLSHSGTAFAVETARSEVQAVADHIIPNYEKDGVLTELKKLLQSME